MALSNWDVLAFGPDGEPCRGLLKSGKFDGAFFEIYKNWGHVADPRMHYDKCKYTAPFVASIEEGCMSISDFQIVSNRHQLQNAFFCFVETREPIEGEDYKTKSKYMAGIGCYGYDDSSERFAEALGVDLSKYENFYTFTGIRSGGESSFGIHVIDGDELVDTFEMTDAELFEKTGEHIDDLDSKWVGVTEELYAEFLKWLEEDKRVRDILYGEDAEEWLYKVKKTKPLRANQGDLYFADRIGLPSGVATGIGEQEESMMIQALRGVKGDG